MQAAQGANIPHAKRHSADSKAGISCPQALVRKRGALLNSLEISSLFCLSSAACVSVCCRSCERTSPDASTS
eukprot:121650-Pleurochrysis_carterae.AAC.1